MKTFIINDIVIQTELDLSVNSNATQVKKRTLQDFDGDVGMYDLYQKMEASFDKVDAKIAHVLTPIEENIKGKSVG